MNFGKIRILPSTNICKKNLCCRVFFGGWDRVHIFDVERFWLGSR